MKAHIARMFEAAPDHLHADAVLTLPPAGKTGGVKFPTSEAAHAFNEWLEANPYTFVDKNSGETKRVASDVAKSVPRKIRGKTFAPVYQALLSAGCTKDEIIQTHVGHDTRPETTLPLAGKDDRVHKVGVFKFELSGSCGHVVSFEAGQLVLDSPKLARLLRDAAGLGSAGSAASRSGAPTSRGRMGGARPPAGSPGNSQLHVGGAADERPEANSDGARKAPRCTPSLSESYARARGGVERRKSVRRVELQCQALAA